MFEEKILKVDVFSDNSRLDKFIASKLKHISRSEIQRMILCGNVFVDGKKNLQANNKVKLGEVYKIGIATTITKNDIKPYSLRLCVIYEDSDILIINKPAGLVIHAGAGNVEKTLVNVLFGIYGESFLGVGQKNRPGIVHRLDKETSGLMLIAKSDIAYERMVLQMQRRLVKRKYIAVVKGAINPSEGVINMPIGRNKTNRQKMQVLKIGGKNAITYYKTQKFLCNGSASVVECNLLTGRTHQIRVHFSYLGHPIIGDKKYSRVGSFPILRHALHAFYLSLCHPISDKFLEFIVDIPEDIEHLIKNINY